MSISRSLIKVFLLPALAALLAACDGASTVSNPDLSSNGVTGYQGPAARTEDIRSFQLNFWNPLKEDDRCGQCHGAGQPPTFVNKTDVNAAYSVAIQYVSLLDPASSRIVNKALTGHQCWLGPAGATACAANIEQMISRWASDSNVTSQRQIQLTVPTLTAPGDARSFPPFATLPAGTSFADTVHPLLIAHCQNCHEENASNPIAPFFANSDPASAYEAAKPKMDIDNPANSRFVLRLGQEFHNCWTITGTGCAQDAATMEAVITAFATGIPLTPIDTSLQTSMALKIGDGIVAAGGNRHESNMIALWEFRTGSGNRAFDTSGIDPSITLQINGSPQWLSSFGLDLSNGGFAFANNADSAKLKTFIESTGEYSIEAWLIPANVTQQNASIIGYTGSTTRNFTLGQEMYNYEHFNRIDPAAPLSPQQQNGEPRLTSGDSNLELLQSTLQHVVANYDPINGRSMYLNGKLVEDPNAPGVSLDTLAGPTTIGNVVWDSNFGFALGAESNGSNNWDGQVRLVAIHNRVFTAAQALQNFEVGVGQKYLLLFWVGHHLGETQADPKSFILFEISQFDNYSYLFSNPRFINLDAVWVPSNIPIQGMRIGINGKEALTGQAYANIDETINAIDYDPQLGQLLSPLGTIIALDKSADADEFFLTFELIGTAAHTFVDPQPPAPPAPVDPAAAVVSDIGMRTFEEISASIAAITGIPVNDTTTFPGSLVSVKRTYDSYMQQLPTTEAIDAFLPSHQMAIAQLALASCNTLVEINPGYFAPFVMTQDARSAFGEPPAATHYSPAEPTAGTALTVQQIANRAAIVDALMTAAVNADLLDTSNNLTTQPEVGQVQTPVGAQVPGLSGLLGAGEPQDLGLPASGYESLISEMLGCRPPGPTVTDPNPTCSTVNSPARTKQIVKAVCAVAVGSTTMLVQ